MYKDIDEFPKIIHQIYGFWDNIIPKHIQTRIETWKMLHSDYKYKLWNKKSCRKFLKRYYSWFIYIYDSYLYEIQRADAVRYFILYHYGGIYSDIDLEPIKSITPLLERHKDKGCVLYKSANSGLLTNDFMISKPKNVFWKRVWYEMISSYNLNALSKHLIVMYTTGPLMLDSAYEKFYYKKKNTIYIISSKYINNCDISKQKPCYNKEAYLRRYDGNTWHGIDSYIFNIFYKHYKRILFFIFIGLIILWFFRRNKT